MKKPNRRKFLSVSLSLLGLGAIVTWFQKNTILRWMISRIHNDGVELTPAPAIGEDICVLTSSQTEGPFFISSPLRADIREDRQGRELNLNMQILRMPDCKPIPGAVVEIWHCDAEGIYSGYPEDIGHDPWKSLRVAGIGNDRVEPITEARFLRGALETDAEGKVSFTTIFPGWYEPRTPHIHFKVMVGEEELITSQFYFEPDLCNRIYLQTEPYTKWGESPFTPENDVVISEDLQATKGLLLQPAWRDAGALEAAVRVGVRRMG